MNLLTIGVLLAVIATLVALTVLWVRRYRRNLINQVVDDCRNYGHDLDFAIDDVLPKFYKSYNSVTSPLGSKRYEFFTAPNKRLRFLVIAFQLRDLYREARERAFQELAGRDPSGLITAAKEPIFELQENLNSILERARMRFLFGYDDFERSIKKHIREKFGDKNHGELFLYFFPAGMEHFRALGIELKCPKCGSKFVKYDYNLRKYVCPVMTCRWATKKECVPDDTSALLVEKS